MAKTNVKTQTGNRIIVKFDGQTVGLVQSVSMADDYGLEPASGIGDMHAQEYVPSQARHTVNVSNMVLKSNNMRLLGITPENADAVLAGVVFDIVTQDKDTGKALRTYKDCSYASGSVEVQKHAIVMANAVFMALNVIGGGF